MAYRDKTTYDDMGTHRQGRSSSERDGTGSRKVVVAVVLLGVVICIAVVVVWLMLFPSEPKKPNPSQLVIDAQPPVTQSKPVVPGTKEEVPATQNVDADSLARIPVVQTPLPSAVPVKQPVASGISYKQHVVKEGETLDSIATAYGLTKETLISVNRIRNITAIKAGDIWKIPDRDGQLYTVQTGDSLSIITSRYNPTLGWKTLQEINGLSTEVIHPGQELFIPATEVEADGSFAQFDRFVRPAEGRIGALYGQMVKYPAADEPMVLKAIWIEAAAGSPVMASASGVVVDVGNETAGLGRFIVLSHTNGYRTTYGHLDTVSVKVGDQVRQSDVIGTVGSSGDIERPLLHFSLEQEGIALNPVNFF